MGVQINHPIPRSLGHILVHSAHRLTCPQLTKKLKEKKVATNGSVNTSCAAQLNSFYTECEMTLLTAE